MHLTNCGMAAPVQFKAHRGLESTLALPTINETGFNISEEEYRQELSDQMARILLPVMVILGLFLLVGVVGNSLVLYIYLCKVPPSATRPTILALACFDLLACFVSIPGEILDIRYSYNFMSDKLCKVMRLGTFIFLIASGLTLLLVALDRYRRICHPLRNQIMTRQAWKRVGGAVVVALVLSSLSPLVYANREIETPTPGVKGMECSTDPNYKKVAFVYKLILGVVFLAAFTIMTVAYILIARRVLRQGRFRRSSNPGKPEKASQSGAQLSIGCKGKTENQDLDISLSDITKDEVSEPPERSLRGTGKVDKLDVTVSPERSFSDTGKLDVTVDLDAKRVSTIVRNDSSLYRKPSIFQQLRHNSLDATTRRTTLMLFLITLMFVISFMPHLIISIVQTATKSLHSHTNTDANNIMYNMFIRSYFLNTAANPFIYGFCSPLFRRECKKLILGFAFCWKRKTLSNS